MTDLTDYTEAWLMNAADTQTEPGVIAVDFSQTNGLDSLVGHVEDPASSFLSRGYVSPVGGTTGDVWLFHNNATSDIFDVRGATSMTVAGWCRLKADATGDPHFLSTHGVSSADEQAFETLMIHNTLGANPSPSFDMEDGLSAFNRLNVQANDQVTMAVDVWQFVAGGWNSVTNKIFNFWGRAVGEHYYKEADGFAAGFGYDGTSETYIGKFTASGGNGISAQAAMDQTMWWNGRALTEDDLVFLWNDHAGRALNNLDDTPICWNYTAFYRNSMKTYKASGPGAFPRRLKVPGNVDITRGMMVDDGKLIDPDNYEVS